MLCYKDRAFCPFYIDCRRSLGCDRAATPFIEKQAEIAGLPISYYMAPPECFSPVEGSAGKLQEEQA